MADYSNMLYGQPALPDNTIYRQMLSASQPQSDYDYDGYVAKYGVPDQSKGQHLTDEFKLPNHVTFSDQSIYHSPATPGGQWQPTGMDRWQYTPSDYVLSQHPADKLADYFTNQELTTSSVKLPDGRIVYGTKAPAK
jgi:hypothetical protein